MINLIMIYLHPRKSIGYEDPQRFFSAIVIFAYLNPIDWSKPFNFVGMFTMANVFIIGPLHILKVLKLFVY